MRRILLALAAALIAGVVTVLALAAAVDAWTHDGAIVLIAIAAVFTAQAIPPLLRSKANSRRGLR